MRVLRTDPSLAQPLNLTPHGLLVNLYARPSILIATFRDVVIELWRVYAQLRLLVNANLMLVKGACSSIVRVYLLLLQSSLITH